MAWKRIVNASPIIFLTRLNRLDLLNEPGVIVLVPDAVLAELGFLGPDDPAAVAVRSRPWIHGVPTPEIPAILQVPKLGAGETAVLALALAEGGSDKDVVIDDWRARRRAESLGIKLRGTLAFLLIAKSLGRIESIHPLLEELRHSGMYFSDQLMQRILRQARE